MKWIPLLEFQVFQHRLGVVHQFCIAKGRKITHRLMGLNKQ